MSYKLEFTNGNTKKVMLPSGSVYTKVSVKSQAIRTKKTIEKKREIYNELIKPIAMVLQNAKPNWDWSQCVKVARKDCLVFGHEKALEIATELYNLNK